ncbi:MAG: YggS family pyridoxal phosphate-dependent enzyme [Acidobacteria bacterium]|nr:YggS family pyridoxal phosphate-dependent enzyme [Acidobacteriota bacterium]
MRAMKEIGTVAVAENLARVQERIEAARRRAGWRSEVRLVAVTKQVPPERIAEAYRAGVRHFGENRVQEFEDKRRWLVLPEAVWHLVGHLQTNKARRAVELFDRLDSLDSARLAEKIAGAAAAMKRTVPVLVQVHLGEEATKHGIEPELALEMVEQMARLEAIAIEGLMTMPPFLEPAERVRPYFRRLRELAEEIDRRRLPSVRMSELSMGMSHDFEVAIEEGATQVRLGTALFGPRPAR